jgi:hypothetical protein
MTVERGRRTDAAGRLASFLERGLLTMRWEEALFAHWPVAPAVVDDRLPRGVEVDTHDGRAWLGVVPFAMTDIRPRWAPVGLSFPELNLRTYVTHDGEPGVYFFSLDADDRLGVAVARRLFRLPYYRADARIERRGDERRVRSRRTHPGVPPCSFDATYAPEGPTFRADERPFERYLVERYRFYTTDDDGRLYAADIDHEPWPLREARAEIVRNDCFRANGFDHPDGDPVLHYCAGIDVTAGRLRRLPASPDV